MLFVIYHWTSHFPQAGPHSADYVQYHLGPWFALLLYFFLSPFTWLLPAPFSWPYVYIFAGGFLVCLLFIMVPSFLLSVVLINVSKFLFKRSEVFLEKTTSCRTVGGKARSELRATSKLPTSRGAMGQRALRDSGGLASPDFGRDPARSPPLLQVCTDGWAHLLLLQPWDTYIICSLCTLIPGR